MTLKRKQRRLSDNDTFVSLMLLGKKDKLIRNRLLFILQVEPFHRKSLLSELVQQMKRNRVSYDFIAAVSSLREDVVADMALQLLKDEC